MTVIIEGNGKPFDIEDGKRFYMPVVVTVECPACGQKVTRDLTDHYLSYPTANVPQDMHFEHDVDDNRVHLFSVAFVLRVTLEPVEVTS